ncbi:MAG: calcium/sodium antiporter [Candidatus Lokiarchaeota archaeon]|nr:calcium/sodium antiporter [Candidatus Lokiarchaeota archaeon]
MELGITIVNLGLFAGGLALLVYSADIFVEYASQLAVELGISELTIGLTIVAIGTSMPEIISSLVAILAGKPSLAFGNVIGSFLANLTLIIGLSALISPLSSNAVVLERDSKIMILAILGLVAALLEPISPGVISFWEALLLLLLFVTYLAFLYSQREESLSSFQFPVFIDYLIRLRFLTTIRGLLRKPVRPPRRVSGTTNQEESSGGLLAKYSVIVLGSLILIVIGAQALIIGVDYIATEWRISEGLVGLTLVAIGTSLPELAVSINSARRGFGRLLIGNVIGSNIVNITLALGIGGLLSGIEVGMLQGLVMAQLAAAVALVFHYVIRRDWRVTRNEGILLLSLFFLSQLVLIVISLLPIA